MMSDEAAVGAVIDEMYAMISGPKGPRDWSRQANCFLPEALQVQTWIDEQGRPQKLSMTLDEYQANTTPFFAATTFTKSRRAAASSCSAISRTCGAAMRRGARPTMRIPNGAE